MFRKKQSLGFRIWHWANALLLMLSLFTVLARKTFLSIKGNTVLIMEKAQATGAVLTESQAKDIARMLRNPVWQWHTIIGFGIIGLLVFRLYLHLKDRKKAKVSLENKSLHYKLVKKNYVLFYLLLTVAGITGLLLYWDDYYTVSKNVHEFIKETHEIIMWYFVIFIVGHILGVIYTDRGEDKGFISDMINGGDDNLK